MSDWQLLVDLLTLLWLIAWTLRALSDISSKRARTAAFVIVVFFIFYGVPLALDLCYRVPQYNATPGFRTATQTPSVALIYDLFIAACPVFWWLASAPRVPCYGAPTLPQLRRGHYILWALLVSPLVALAFAPQPDFYLTYGAVLTQRMSPEMADFHGNLSALILLSVVAGAGLLVVRRSTVRTLWLVLPILTAGMWIQGKRSIVVLTVALIWVAMHLRGVLTRSRTITLGALTVGALCAYIGLYQLYFRPSSIADSYTTYENTRIDFGRDHNLRAVIYCELSNGSERVLQFRGQSILFDLTMFVPRAIWNEKPWPYAIYMTAFALHGPQRSLGWGLTTSLLDEAIANFSWAGFLIGPLMFAWLCRVCDHTSNSVVRVGGVLIACLLMSVQLPAFIELLAAWVVYAAWTGHSERKRRVLLGGARRGFGRVPVVALERSPEGRRHVLGATDILRVYTNTAVEPIGPSRRSLV